MPLGIIEPGLLIDADWLYNPHEFARSADQMLSCILSPARTMESTADLALFLQQCSPHPAHPPRRQQPALLVHQPACVKAQVDYNPPIADNSECVPLLCEQCGNSGFGRTLLTEQWHINP